MMAAVMRRDIDQESASLESAYVDRVSLDDQGMRLKFGPTAAQANGRGVMLSGYFINQCEAPHFFL